MENQEVITEEEKPKFFGKMSGVHPGQHIVFEIENFGPVKGATITKWMQDSFKTKKGLGSWTVVSMVNGNMENLNEAEAISQGGSLVLTDIENYRSFGLDLGIIQVGIRKYLDKYGADVKLDYLTPTQIDELIQLGVFKDEE